MSVKSVQKVPWELRHTEHTSWAGYMKGQRERVFGAKLWRTASKFDKWRGWSEGGRQESRGWPSLGRDVSKDRGKRRQKHLLCGRVQSCTGWTQTMNSKGLKHEAGGRGICKPLKIPLRHGVVSSWETPQGKTPWSFAYSCPQCCLEAQSRKHTRKERAMARDGSEAAPIIRISLNPWGGRSERHLDTGSLVVWVSVIKRKQRWLSPVHQNLKLNLKWSRYVLLIASSSSSNSYSSLSHKDGKITSTKIEKLRKGEIYFSDD